jgi:glycosyltransferase involved in cell wall biosynthesis
MILATSKHNDGGIGRVVNQLVDWLEHQHNGRILKYDAQAYLGRFAFYLNLLRAVVRTEQPMILFTHPGLARIAKWLPRVQYAVMVHGWELDRIPHQHLEKVFEGAKNVICSTSYIRQMLETNFSLENVTQALYPIPLKNHGTYDIEKSAHPTILHVGRMNAAERYKGHDELLEAFQSVLEQYPRAELLLVGHGNDRNRLEQKAKQLGLSDSISFTGFVSDSELVQLYQKSWLFCLPSSGEGQGLVYGEALAFGLPIIALQDSPAAEQISDDQEGILIDRQDPELIAQAIKRLLNDKELRSRMALAAKKRYEALQQQTEHFWNLMETLNS